MACHKPVDGIYRNNVYTPIHVGRTVSRFKDEMSDMIGDDTGDNISDKNGAYSELTAQYWAWKNVKDVEYIGFCHYRRYFNIDINEDNIGKLLDNNDVILLGCKSIDAVENNMIHYMSIEDVTIFMMVLRRLYPEYEQSLIDYLWNNEIHNKNMLVCRKDIFDGYAEWLFSILSECEKYIRTSPYSRGKRLFGYLGEFFMAVYFLHHNYKILNVGAINNPQNIKLKGSCEKAKIEAEGIARSLFYKIRKLFKSPPKTLDDYFLPEVLLGLKMDGICPE